VQKGGGLVGIAEPSASATPGQLFKLSHVLGLDRDRGERLANGKYKFTVSDAKHFITADLESAPDFGKEVDGIYVFGPATKVLLANGTSPRLATHEFGQGRAVYLSGHKFAYQNTRLIHRAIHWAANREAEFQTWNSSNIRTESAFFAKQKKLVVINNSGEAQKTKVWDAKGKTIDVSLKAHDIAILDV
jgi:beta-D-galactosyl-(1->4)-L-rhamnose phosphorylase